MKNGTTQDLQRLLEEHFFWLHRHPELSYQERQTTGYIRSILNEAHIDIIDTPLETGLIARVGGKGPAAALRADIDALAVTEATGLPYASENAGVMHACGHDFHTAALIGAALRLKAIEAKLPGEVRLVFQPAEEVSGGATSVLKTGALDGVSEIYGLHCSPDYQSGIVALRAGGTYAAVIALKIKITGKGGHAAIPQQSRDPLVAAAALILAAQTIVSRNADPFDQLVVSFTRLEAGTTWNVIPGEALIEGTIRALSTEKARAAMERLEAMCKGAAAMHQTEITIDWLLDTPATNNDAALTEFAAKTALDLGFPVVSYTPTMAGEDFALYQERIPGVFFNFGVASPQCWHHPQFKADITHLARAAELLAALAAGSLARLAEHT